MLRYKLCSSFPCQPHGRCKGSSRQHDKESGHRVGSLWSPCQCCSTSKCRAGFNLHKLLESVFPGLCISMTCRVQSFQRLQWRTTRILGLIYSGCQFHIALLKDWEFQKRCVTVERPKIPQEKLFIKQKKLWYIL